MHDITDRRDLAQLKLSLSILKNKISLSQEFLKQAQDEAYRLQEALFDFDDSHMDKIQLFVNNL
jgi:hypothetical protein